MFSNMKNCKVEKLQKLNLMHEKVRHALLQRHIPWWVTYSALKFDTRHYA